MAKTKSKIKRGDYVLLLSKQRSYLVKVENKKLNTDFGVVNIAELVNKNYGCIVQTHLKHNFVVVKPSIVDFLNKKAKMLPQAVRPKDAALILSFTGINSDSIIVEAGTGSAWLTLFLANYVKQVYSYEKREDFYQNAKRNVELSGMKNITLKHKDILQGIDETNVDAVILDMLHAERAVSLAFNALKPGGWLVVYSPYIEQVKAVTAEIKKYNFAQPVTVENIVRQWDVRQHTLPKRQGLLHTGFLTFARKLY